MKMKLVARISHHVCFIYKGRVCSRGNALDDYIVLSEQLLFEITRFGLGSGKGQRVPMVMWYANDSVAKDF